LAPGVLAAWPSKTRHIVLTAEDVEKSRTEYKTTETANSLPQSDYDPIL